MSTEKMLLNERFQMVERRTGVVVKSVSLVVRLVQSRRACAGLPGGDSSMRKQRATDIEAILTDGHHRTVERRRAESFDYLIPYFVNKLSRASADRDPNLITVRTSRKNRYFIRRIVRCHSPRCRRELFICFGLDSTYGFKCPRCGKAHS